MFALGGIAVRDTDWPELRDRWQAALSEARCPLDREVKWHGIRKGEVPDALADAVFETLAGSPLTCYVTVLDLDRGSTVFPTTDVISLREQGAGNPALFVDAPVVLSFAKDMDLSTECSAYSGGGLSFKFGFGDYAGHTLTMLHWHSLLHETDSGDVAPGLGEFKVNAEGES